MRVPVDPGSHDPAGDPEFIAGSIMADDLCLDEDAGVSYLTLHQQNTIERASLRSAPAPGRSSRASRSTSSSSDPLAPCGDAALATTAGSRTSPPTEGWTRSRQMTWSGPPGCCGSSCPPQSTRRTLART
jgi:hypothetical protein